MVLEHLRQPLVLQQRDARVPGPGEVRIAIEACAVCRTDLHVVDGELPDPVLPMMAVVRPGEAVNEMPDRTGSSAPGYRNEASRSSRWPRVASSVTGESGAATEDRVPSTSWMRSAHTAARGAMTATNVAIITDMRMSTK